MSEYLKREDVRRAVLHNEGDAVIAAIDELPVTSINEKRGEWIQRGQTVDGHFVWLCSNCGAKLKTKFTGIDVEKHCFNCGATMTIKNKVGSSNDT